MAVVLVTGGAGYIGSHACKALRDSGHTPVTFDNLDRGFRHAVRFGPLFVGDLLDRAALDAALARYRPTAVLHFAGYAYVGESVGDPLLYYRNNALGTLTLLQAMVSAEVNTLVFSSSCAVYWIPDRIPITEDHPQRPVNPYGASKMMAERMIADTASAHGRKAVMLRYFNAAGADPDGEIGENHSPETHLIPLVLDAMLGRVPDIRVHGDTYDTPDGTCVRDYVHVSDLAEAHLRALEYLRGGGDTIALNLGNGRGASVREVIGAAERVTGRRATVRIEPRRAGDPPVLIGDPGRAREVLGWRPRRSDLHQQIGDAWRWRTADPQQRKVPLL
jgi:UDP-arabinose 4-epimerase